jgi:allantoin racemase
MAIGVGLIRVLTTEDPSILDTHGKLIESRFPELKVESRCIADQPMGIFDEQSCAIAIPKICKLGKEMEREGIRAIIVSCADDPAVTELRKMIRVPVIGAGSSSACLALSLGTRIGTLGITETTPRVMKEILGKHLIGETRPEGVRTTLDLMTAQGRENALKAVERLRRSGAEVIALACTGYATIGIKKDLERTGRVPVVDAVEAAGLWHFTRRI